ncbi:hypothetical protein KIN20_003221 [Parelaphostrongylus tenuis]|uniref:Uncharacterized protein n=1 Tax=Parelaphostrongylus tenuis TaxID=148309 RepID=A0AAD5QDK0_PARTN|nr:hypothetical protein KIN20_003221 [Parelaphostrongylus tenuis]
MTVTGFLPINMAYSKEVNVRVKTFGTAASSDEVQTFVSRLVMQTVFDVLEQQSRLAVLPDTIISSILNQLAAQVRYEALEYKGVEQDPKELCSAEGGVAEKSINDSYYDLYQLSGNFNSKKCQPRAGPKN